MRSPRKSRGPRWRTPASGDDLLAPPRLPAAVRTMNALGRPVARLLPQLSLEADALLDEARRRTGLRDFGDPHFMDGLRAFARSLDEEAELTPLGRSITHREIVGFLSTRLRLQQWRHSHPEIAEERVERPVVIMGMARTGTSILHDLLAQDPRNRVPLTWEVDEPFPPPEAVSYESDPRIEASDRQLARVDQLIPGFKNMHPMGARLPQECVQLLAPEFASMTFHTAYRVPGYARWLHEEADLEAAYRGHRRMLQLLQWHHPGRWVLKSPCHLWHLRALLATYPDAVLVQTHRDPLRVLSSLTSLMTTLRALSMRPECIDPHEIAREWAAHNARAFERAVDAREQGLVSKDQVLDLQFAEFMADPFATLRRVYDFAGLTWSDEAQARMRAHLEANPSDKHGGHRYRFADTGLDAQAERARVRRYQEHFGIPSEAL